MDKKEKKDKKKDELEEIFMSLSPIEREVLPFLKTKDALKISSQAKQNITTVKRALQFLETKGIVKTILKKDKVVKLGDNGVIYLKSQLPERKLLDLIAEKKSLTIDDAKKLSKLSDNEFTIALGVLKQKALIDLKDKIKIKPSTEPIKLMLEEKFLKQLPIAFNSLSDEQKLCYEKLRTRKELIKLDEVSELTFDITELGEKVLLSLGKIEKLDLIEELTPEMIVKQEWQGKKFRRYDITGRVPELHGAKKHFVNQAIEYARRIWTEFGFKEMQGTLTQTSFWNFDALFTAQDHPVREMQDTFYLKAKGKLPDKKIVQSVKQVHEKGVQGSKGWNYEWKEDEAKRVVLRTHTTCLSANTLYQLSKLKDIKDKKGKFFAIGRCFRNETVDWSHGFEFNQTEGIVVDKDANFSHLLGYLKEFFKKMGHEKIRFRPSYFPYTEPSVEIDVFIPEKNKWLELGGAGIFRPEVVIPLLGEYVPVLAWGPGFDRIIMDYYGIKDLRDTYSNDLNKTRKLKFWMK